MPIALSFGGKIVGRIPTLTKYRIMSDKWKVVEINLTNLEIIKKIDDILEMK